MVYLALNIWSRAANTWSFPAFYWLKRWHDTTLAAVKAVAIVLFIYNLQLSQKTIDQYSGSCGPQVRRKNSECFNDIFINPLMRCGPWYLPARRKVYDIHWRGRRSPPCPARLQQANSFPFGPSNLSQHSQLVGWKQNVEWLIKKRYCPAAMFLHTEQLVMVWPVSNTDWTCSRYQGTTMLPGYHHLSLATGTQSTSIYWSSDIT